ncbi:hypothetical protein ERX46_17210 [Brumimicrobium glaciale]|uniref:Septum formation inhibitor Maf n=1 Tax=Brumimicrobium glaciale TaxID=200475 RepID=A0A4Q4KE17_9FLAO|nr:hypothetical protein [Brumimicrobium glaciale]RYM30820.1 hypothetical protein ERX46_17210 [Brumimicrobium glaciale]
MKLHYISPILFFLFLSCENKTNSKEENTSTVDVPKIESDKSVNIEEDKADGSRSVKNLSDKSYDLSYFSGKAEVATYKLTKARYKDKHPGEAVLIFVTEPFLINKQVKADQPTSENSVKVLKMNRIDRFSTGIYDYSQFTSVFTPIEKYDVHYPLKMTLGSQDWCGQSFTQINNNDGFEYEHKSYFESDGDTSYHIDYVLTEDNIFNLARLSIDLLPVGEFEIFPSLTYLRNSHLEVKNYTAVGTLDYTETGFFYVYEIPELRRSVRFFLSSENQNRILSWEESYPTVTDNVMRTSTYELKGVKVLPYWELNKKENAGLRKELKMMY